VTELVTNSLKHAFPQGKGKIEVVLERRADKSIGLVVSDNGTGQDPAQSPPSGKSSGLGTSLIDGLVSQLNATIRVIRMNGTRSEVLFAQGEIP
jgi:two-component sensor histidine kinase